MFEIVISDVTRSLLLSIPLLSLLFICNLYCCRVHKLIFQSQFQVVGFFTSIFQANGFRYFSWTLFADTNTHDKLKSNCHWFVSNGVTLVSFNVASSHHGDTEIAEL
ncbi:MAG: hypothetical protein LBC61_00105 [Candidatus Peribacteria bacterium]|nr:hypothetical protein [Candidatus Peribacteria bacterium]